MVDVRINQVDSQIDVADIDGLLTPEVMNMIVRAVTQKIEEDQRVQKASDDDRRLSEGALR